MSEHPPESSPAPVHGAPQTPPPPPPRSGGGFPVIAIVLIVVAVFGVGVLLCGGLVLGISLPALGTARQAAMQLQAMTNARAVAQGLVIYEQQEGALPPADSDWAALLVDLELIDPAMLELPQGLSGVTTYFYVPAQNTDGMATQVLLYEHPLARDGGGIVVYADSSATYIEDPEFTTIIEALTLPDGTPWAPHDDVPWPAAAP